MAWGLPTMSTSCDITQPTSSCATIAQALEVIPAMLRRSASAAAVPIVSTLHPYSVHTLYSTGSEVQVQVQAYGNTTTDSTGAGTGTGTAGWYSAIASASWTSSATGSAQHMSPLTTWYAASATAATATATAASTAAAAASLPSMSWSTAQVQVQAHLTNGQAQATQHMDVYGAAVAWPKLGAMAVLPSDASSTMPRNASDWHALAAIRAQLQPLMTSAGITTSTTPHTATTSSTTSSTSATTPFTAVVGGSSILLLHAEPGHAFLPGMQAWIGNVPAHVLAVSTAGHVAIVQAPNITDMCTTVPCTGPAAHLYRPIWLMNPRASIPGWLPLAQQAVIAEHDDLVSATVPAWVLQNSSTWHTAEAVAREVGASDVMVIQPGQVLGGSTVCPHACPGYTQPGAIPATIQQWLTAVAAVAAQASTTTTAGITAATTSSDNAKYGLYITEQCVGYDQPGPNCLHPTSNCAWGTGDSCKPCPQGAVCPGGERAWALPGWWLPYEGATIDPVPCMAPATERCPGYIATTGTATTTTTLSTCGPAYSADGYACTDCARGYYADDSLRCVLCPTSGMSASAMLPLLMLGAGAVGLLAVATGLAKACSHGMSWKETADITSDWVVWIATSMQVVAVSSVLVQDAMPDVGRKLLSWSKLALLDAGPVVPSACLASPLASRIAQLSLSVVVGLVWCSGVGIQGMRWSVHDSSARGMVKAVVKVMSQVHGGFGLLLLVSTPLALSTALSVLTCVHRSVPVSHVDGTGRVYMSMEDALVLETEPSIQCFKGEHLTAASLAMLGISVHVLLFPVLAIHRARVYAREHADGSSSSSDGGKYAMDHISNTTSSTSSSHTWPCARLCARLCTPRYHVSEVSTTDTPQYLQPFVHRIYQPSYWYAHWWACGATMTATLSRSIVQANEYSLQALIVHAVVLSLVSISYSIALLVTKPYDEAGRWKLPVACAVNLVAMTTAMTQAVSRAYGATTVSTVFAWVAMVLYMGLVLVLVVSFWWMLLEPRARHQVARARSAWRKSKLTGDTDMESGVNPMLGMSHVGVNPMLGMHHTARHASSKPVLPPQPQESLHTMAQTLSDVQMPSWETSDGIQVVRHKVMMAMSRQLSYQRGSVAAAAGLGAMAGGTPGVSGSAGHAPVRGSPAGVQDSGSGSVAGGDRVMRGNRTAYKPMRSRSLRQFERPFGSRV